MGVLQWLLANWYVILLFISGAITLVYIKDWHTAKAVAIGLFLMAEKALANLVIASGPEAMQQVVWSLYVRLPERAHRALNVVATLLGTTPEKLLSRLVQRWYDEITRRYRGTLYSEAELKRHFSGSA